MSESDDEATGRQAEDGTAPEGATIDRAGAAATEAIPGEVSADDPDQDDEDRFDAG